MRKHGQGGHGEINPKADYLSRLGYEGRDVAIPTLIKWFVFLFLFVFGTIAVTFGIYKLFVPEGGEESRSLPLTTVERRPPPDAPIVQIHPKRDMIVFRREEVETLNSYGWVDQGKGIAKIPVDRAIDLIVERGVPAPRGTGSAGGVWGPAPQGVTGSQPGSQTRNQSGQR